MLMRLSSKGLRVLTLRQRRGSSPVTQVADRVLKHLLDPHPSMKTRLGGPRAWSPVHAEVLFHRRTGAPGLRYHFRLRLRIAVDPRPRTDPHRKPSACPDWGSTTTQLGLCKRSKS